MRTPGPDLVSRINGKAVLQTQLHPLCSCPGKLVCHWARAHWDTRQCSPTSGTSSGQTVSHSATSLGIARGQHSSRQQGGVPVIAF